MKGFLLEKEIMETDVSTKPILITHWDPDLYPARPAPGIQELVLYGLLSGVLRRESKVLIKEVDLLLNPKIRAAFEDDAVVGQFDSLLHTGRFKVLLPPLSTDFGDVDPSVQPMTAVARERDRKKRPYKTRIRKLTRADEVYCAKLDRILVGARAIQFRKDFPAENTFARVLCAVLSSPDQGWRKRPQFCGITPRMADTFVTYCQDPSKAVDRLARDGVAPHGREAYRSLLYQVADCDEYKAKHNSMSGSRAMKNLLQSVYAYSELNRESASGTYAGPRIGEIPFMDESPRDFSVIEAAPLLDLNAEIPIAQNIGDILGQVLGEIPAEPPGTTTTQMPFEDRCAHIADAFAKYSVARQPVKWSRTAQHHWRAFRHSVGFGAFVLSSAAFVGLRFVSSFEYREIVEGGLLGIHALAYGAKPLVDLIRGGRAYDERDAERARVARTVVNLMKDRVSHID